ncbi:unnamed protein product [Microthlaspi erraticum]|uniref:DUF577 domain-containing protein n=1 Tax=Microthlaspi erraticum TaxID=1685480 RepID=A0A6D2ITM3_9BRAS|nr:unnamed protein product [Microthlaspi erraticum]
MRKIRVEDWSLALEIVVKMGIQLLDSEMRLGLVKNLLSVLQKAAIELVEKGMEQFLLRGLDNLERFLSRDKNLYIYNDLQCNFVYTFMYKIRELGAHIKEAAKKIHRLIKSSNMCLTMWLEGDEFVIPVMKSLLPDIFKRLNPSRELLVDNSCWVLTFVGAFCAIIHFG